MAKKKTTPALTYGGADITPPPAVESPNLSPNLTLESAIAAAQQGQNAANKANATRYGQGLNVLTGGANSSAGYIQNALTNSAGIGKQAFNRINENEVRGKAEATQSAISRGLGNTSILNALQSIPARAAEDARQGAEEAAAQRTANLNLAQANNAQQNAGTIASFIGNRNDVGPSTSEYANLVQNAAANGTGAPAGVKPTIRVMGSTIDNPLFGPALGAFHSTGGNAGATGGYFQGSNVGAIPQVSAPVPQVSVSSTPSGGRTIVTPLSDVGSPCNNPNTSQLTKQLLGCKG